VRAGAPLAPQRELPTDRPLAKTSAVGAPSRTRRVVRRKSDGAPGRAPGRLFLTLAALLALSAAAQLTGCPAKQGSSHAAPSGDIGPPSVLNPELLDRG